MLFLICYDNEFRQIKLQFSCFFGLMHLYDLEGEDSCVNKCLAIRDEEGGCGHLRPQATSMVDGIEGCALPGLWELLTSRCWGV